MAHSFNFPRSKGIAISLFAVLFVLLSLAGEVAAQDQHFQFEITDANMSILVQSAVIGDNPLVPGDEIGVFTTQGVCAGASMVEEDAMIGIAAWGEENQQGNGFQVNEEIAYRFWDHRENRELPAQPNNVVRYAAFGFAPVQLTAEDVQDENPIIDLSDNSHNFGEVYIDEMAEWDLTVTNGGQSNLTVSEVQLFGDYFGVNSNDAFELEPQASRILTITFAPEAQGEFNGTLFLINNDPDNEEISVDLFGVGVIAQDGLILVPEMLDFGVVDLHSEAMENLIIRNIGDEALIISDIWSEGEGFSVDFMGGGGGELEFDWDFAVTDANMSLLIQSATINDESLVNGDYIGVFREDGLCAGFSLIEEGFPVGVAAWGEEQGQDNGFRANEQIYFRLWDSQTGMEWSTNIEMVNGNANFAAFGFAVARLTADRVLRQGGGDELVIDPDGSYELPVYFIPEETREYRGSLVIQSNDPNGDAVVALLGTGISGGMPEIRLSENFYQFGRVSVNEQDTWELMVFNDGDAELVLNEVNIFGQYFALDFNDQPIAPNGSSSIWVTFAPEESGIFQGELQILSNDPQQPQVLVGLVGTGVADEMISVPDVLDFGEVVLQETAMEYLEIRNIGDDALMISNIWTEGEGFAVEFEGGNGGDLEFDWRHDITDANMSIIIQSAEINDESLVNGDYIGVFREDGLCAGLSQVEDGFPVGIAAWGAEQDRDNGFNNNEAIHFRIWDSQANMEWSANAQMISGQAVYAAFGFAVANLTGREVLRRSGGGLVIEPNDMYELPVYFTPEQEMQYQGILVIESNDPNGDAMVTLLGEGIVSDEPMPRIAVDPQMLNFGILTNRIPQRTLELSILNTGDLDLQIFEIIAEGEGFSIAEVNDEELIIAPEGSYQLPVTFEPPAVGRYEGILTIRSNDPLNENLFVNLLGESVDTDRYYQFAITGDNMSVIVRQALLNGNILQAGDEIGVFTPAGLCAGAEVVEDEWPVGIAVWGDDNTTEQIDGFVANERLNWRFYDASSGREYEAEANYIMGNGLYNTNALFIAELWSQVSEDPIISLTEYFHDYGRVIIDNRATWSLGINNVGAVDLVIDRIAIDAPFFVEDFENLVIAPEEIHYLEVSFNPNEAGNFEGEMQIFSNDPLREMVSVSLSGEGIEPSPPVIVVSVNSIDFGETALNSIVTRRFNVSNRGGNNLVVSEISSESEVFSTNFAEGFELGIDETITITAQFRPTEEQEYASVLHVVSNDPNNEVVDINVTGIGAGVMAHWYYDVIATDVNHSLLVLEATLFDEFLVPGDEVAVFTPNGILAGAALLDTPSNESFGLAAWGDDVHTQIVEGFHDREAFTFAYWDASAEMEYLAAPTWIDGPQVFTGNGFSVLTLANVVMIEPQITVDGEFDFGSVGVGSQAVWEMTIGNTGNGELVVEGIILESEHFSVQLDEELVIPADDEATVEVIFAPQAKGEHITFMTIISNDPNQAEVVVSLYGFAPNRPPEWVEAPPELVEMNEGEIIDGMLAARDPDGDDVAFEIVFSDLPEEVQFTDNGNGTASVYWEISFDDAGEYRVVIAITDGEDATETEIRFVINDVNRRPVIVNPIDDLEIEEDSGEIEVADLAEVFADPDGDNLTFDVRGPDELNLTLQNDRILFLTPDDNWNGSVEVIVTADDGRNGVMAAAIIINNTHQIAAPVRDIAKRSLRSAYSKIKAAPIRDLSEDDVFIVTVTPVNDAPVWVEIPQNIDVDEGQRIEFDVVAMDVDLDMEGDELTLRVIDWDGVDRLGAGFNDDGDGAGSFIWRTNFFHAGEYVLVFEVRDSGGLTDRANVTINVNNVPQAPEIFQPSEDPEITREIDEGEEIGLMFSAEDLDGDPDDLRWRIEPQNLPDGYEFNDHQDGSAEFFWTPGFEDASEYSPIFIVRDADDNEAQIVVNIIVNDLNRAPRFVEPSDSDEGWSVDVNEGEELTFLVLARDLDDDEVQYDVDFGNLPGDPEFNDNGDGSFTFVWTAPFDDTHDNRAFDIALSATDGMDTDILDVTIRVIDVNQPPVVANAIEDVVVDEGVGLFEIADLNNVFNDPENDDLEYGFENAPAEVNMEITDENRLVINPDQFFNLPDGVEITVWASDGIVAPTSFRLTINPVNDPPQAFNLLTPDHNAILAEHRAVFSWEVSVDPDGDQVLYGLFAQLTYGNIDTTVVVPGLDITEFELTGLDTLMQLLGIEDTVRVNWWVIATDGEFAIESNERRTFILPPPTSVKGSDNMLPSEFAMEANYPNPFNATTRVSFSLPNNAAVKLTVWDLRGNLVGTLVNGQMPAGRHQITWDAGSAPAGVYLFNLETNGKRFVSKGLLLK